MPKAPRAKEGNETPKKRTSKAKLTQGDGNNALEPVTTAPANAEAMLEVNAEKATPKKQTSKTKLADPVTVTTATPAVADPGTAQRGSAQPETSAASVLETFVASAKRNGHQAEEPRHHSHTGNGHGFEELVRRRAYELYLQRRGQGGSPEQDWFQALHEIRAQYVA